MAEILKTINGQIITDVGSQGINTIDGLINTKLRTKDKVIITTGTISTVMGVALADISTVMGVASANISTVMGVDKS